MTAETDGKAPEVILGRKRWIYRQKVVRLPEAWMDSNRFPVATQGPASAV